MSETGSNPTATVRTFTVSMPVRACRLRRDDLRNLYRIIQERQSEHRQTVLTQLVQLPTESAEQFEARRAKRPTENELSDFSRLWHDGCG
jgi:hypothetical protein